MGRIASVCLVCNSYSSDSPSITVECVAPHGWPLFLSFSPTRNLDVNHIYCNGIILPSSERSWTHHCLENNCLQVEAVQALTTIPHSRNLFTQN